MEDYSEKIENLRREITDAIIGLLLRHGLTELDFTDPGMNPDAPDAVYVIFFDYNGDPYECIVTKISIAGDSLRITAADKHDGCVFETESPFDLSSRSPIWLNDIYVASQELLESENESLKT